MSAPATALLLLLRLVIADLAIAPSSDTALAPQPPEQPSSLADYEVHRTQEQQKATPVVANFASESGINASSHDATPAASLPAVPEPSKAVFGGDSGTVNAGATEVPNGEWRGADFLRRVLHFVHENQVVLYISFSFVLTGMALLYALMTAYGVSGISSSTSRTVDDSFSRRRLLSDSNNSLPDRQPLLVDGHSPPDGHDSPEYELYSRARWVRSGLTPSPVIGAKSELGGGSKTLPPSHRDSKSLPLQHLK